MTQPARRSICSRSREIAGDKARSYFEVVFWFRDSENIHSLYLTGDCVNDWLVALRKGEYPCPFPADQSTDTESRHERSIIIDRCIYKEPVKCLHMQVKVRFSFVKVVILLVIPIPYRYSPSIRVFYSVLMHRFCVTALTLYHNPNKLGDIILQSTEYIEKHYK